MRTRYFVMSICIMSLFAVNKGFCQDQKGEQKPEQSKGDRREARWMGLQHESGIKEAAIARIVNNPRLASNVGLSEEQVKILKNSLEETRKQHADLQKQLNEAGLEQAKLMTENTVDENAILAAVEKAGKINTEIAKSRVKHMLLVKKTLKPEQVDKIENMVQKRIKQMRKENETGKEGEILKERRDRMKKNQPEEKKDKSEAEKPAANI